MKKVTTVQDVFRKIQPEGHSFSMARRHVAMEDTRFNGELVTSMVQELEVEEGSVFQVGKRHTWQREGSAWIKLVPLEDGKKYLAQLRDTEDDKLAPICLNIQSAPTDRLVMIGAVGYGEKTAAEGHGFPIVIEHHEGKLRMLVWAEINREEPTHVISLEGAREDGRVEESILDQYRFNDEIHP